MHIQAVRLLERMRWEERHEKKEVEIQFAADVLTEIVRKMLEENDRAKK